MYRHLETERLLIRPIRMDDSEFILALVNSKGWIEFIGDRNVNDNNGAREYIIRILDNEKFFYSVFELKDSKMPIGIVSFLYREKHDYPDIGFAVLPGFEKKGYALEATKKYLEEIIKEKLTDRVIAITKPGNINSIRLLEKLGLQFEKAYLEDSVQLCLYSLDL